MSEPLPDFILELSCKCANPTKIGYSTLQDNFTIRQADIELDDRVRRNAPIGMFCTLCLRPSGPYSTKSAIRTCDGCGNYYVPKPIEGTYPIKHFLCSNCDVPVKKRTTKKITFS